MSRCFSLWVHGVHTNGLACTCVLTILLLARHHGYARGRLASSSRIWPNDSPGLSLWLVPTPEQTTLLKRVMAIKPSSTNSPSSFPDFQPHITLATTPTAAGLKEAIPDNQLIIRPKFRSVDVGDKYFMSIYARVHDTDALAELRQHLRARLGDAVVPPIPHVSLYYIDNADVSEREKVKEELENKGCIIERPHGVALDCSEHPGNTSSADEVLEGIDGEEIWIMQCNGPVPTWEVIEKVKLK